MKISIAIPCYEYGGFGAECLEYSFTKMKEQVFDDFEIVVSDQSFDYKIRDLCNSWARKLHIKYIHNKETGNAAQNMNVAINNCDGEWVKILCQDDFLAYDNSLLLTAKALDEDNDNNWLATGYVHSYDRKGFFNYHQPSLHANLAIINNIGTPSCVTFKNIKPMLEFDTNLTYYYDCEYYFRFLNKYGIPKLINSITIVNYLWDKSMTSKVDDTLIERETNYIIKKHNLI